MRNAEPRPTTYEEWDALEADRDRLASELQATRAELERVIHLLRIALPHVEASAGAEHLFDGFRPRVRPLDATVDDIRAALAIMETGRV